MLVGSGSALAGTKCGRTAHLVCSTVNYSITPGATVTGHIVAAPVTFVGLVTIAGAKASHGRLTLLHGELTGHLRPSH